MSGAESAGLAPEVGTGPANLLVGQGGWRWVPWVLGLLAGGAIFLGTPNGAGLTPDALAYMRSAGLLASGGPLSQLPTQWPPGFPMALAAARLLISDPIVSARLCMSLIGAINAWLLFRLLRTYRVGPRKALLATVLVLIQPTPLGVNLMVWSESLFTTLVLLDLMLLPAVIEGSGGTRSIVLLALACGASIMVRYAGVFLVVVNAVAILSLSARARNPLDRLKWTIAATAVSLLPLLAWFVFNHWRGQAATNRVLAWHPAGWTKFGELATTIGQWFFLGPAFGVAILLAIFGAAAIVLARAFRRPSDRQDATLAWCVLAYFGFLWASISLVDYYTPLDNRILAPIFPVIFCLFAVLVERRQNRQVIARWLAIPVLLWALAGAHASTVLWKQSRNEGLFLSNRGFRELPVLEPLRRLPPNIRILSNGPELVELYAHHAAAMFPENFSPTSGLPTPGYEQAMAKAVANTDLLVYFQSVSFRSYLPKPAELDKQSGFGRIFDDGSAIVWARISSPPAPPTPAVDPDSGAGP